MNREVVSDFFMNRKKCQIIFEKNFSQCENGEI